MHLKGRIKGEMDKRTNEVAGQVDAPDRRAEPSPVVIGPFAVSARFPMVPHPRRFAGT